MTATTISGSVNKQRLRSRLVLLKPSLRSSSLREFLEILHSYSEPLQHNGDQMTWCCCNHLNSAAESCNKVSNDPLPYILANRAKSISHQAKMFLVPVSQM